MKIHTQWAKQFFATLLFSALVLVFSIHPAGSVFKIKRKSAHE